jgi:hypothetical protein
LTLDVGTVRLTRNVDNTAIIFSANPKNSKDLIETAQKALNDALLQKYSAFGKSLCTVATVWYGFRPV